MSKNKKLYVFGVLFIVAICVYLLIRPADKSSLENNAEVPNISQQKTAPIKSEKPSEEYQVSSTGTIIENVLSPDWDTPISFYGIVLDSNNQPVDGANIRFMWTDRSLSGTSEFKTTSGPAGRFKLTSVNGKFLQVFVSKKGYQNINKSISGFEYYEKSDPDFIIPQQNQPIKFILEKVPEAQDLIELKAQSIRSLENTEQRIKLASKSGTEVWFELSSKIEFDGENYFGLPWQFKIRGLNGLSFIESKNTSLFFAPESGYSTVLNYKWPIPEKKLTENQRPWIFSGDKVLFYKTSEGLYGRMLLRFSRKIKRTGEKYVNFTISSKLNPNESRNLFEEE